MQSIGAHLKWIEKQKSDLSEWNSDHRNLANAVKRGTKLRVPEAEEQGRCHEPSSSSKTKACETSMTPLSWGVGKELFLVIYTQE